MLLPSDLEDGWKGSFSGCWHTRLCFLSPVLTLLSSPLFFLISSSQVLTGEVMVGAFALGLLASSQLSWVAAGRAGDSAVEDFFGVTLKPSFGFLARRLLTTAFALVSAGALAVFTGMMHRT